MVLSDGEIKEYVRRLLLSRMRILCNNGFYGLLLMHMKFAIDEDCETAATDGRTIYFGPEFLKSLSDSELDFVMMHEILHVVLQHCFRGNDCEPDRFNIACDIVVNSNILLSNNMNISSISIRQFGGAAMHLAPDGKEGYEYTAEQVYEMLPQVNKKNKKSSGIGSSGGKGNGGSEGGSANEKGNDDYSNNSEDCAQDDNNGNSEEKSSGKGGSAGKGKGGGIECTDGDGKISSSFDKGRAKKEKSTEKNRSGWDDHTRWTALEDDSTLREVWAKRFEDACEAIIIKERSTGRGRLPAFAERILNELRTPQTDWRKILNDFIQEDVVDYSFMPPDRRFDDGPFYLPDFNEKDESVENVLFMIDTSGSMDDDMITAAYSEIKGAIDQFNGRLKGWLGFFDAAIIEPKPFESEEEFRIIKPAGGGGTDFQIIFEYVHFHMQDNPPISIIILTDGYAPFPQPQLAGGIPVLWLINNEEVDPPWGKVARIKVH